MANLPEFADWADGIYQLETTDPVLGGPDGIDNLQAKQLASRTRWLRELLERLGEEKAPLDSPVFAGTPTVPTPGTSDNSLQIANTAFVQLAIAAVVGAAPETLNEIHELAKAIGEDPNFSVTMANALAGKQASDATLTALAGLTTAANQLIYSTGADQFAMTPLSAFARTLLDDIDAAAARTTLGAAPLNSPGLTGTPTAPTAAASTNSTQIANTAFVQAAIAARVGAMPVGSQYVQFAEADGTFSASKSPSTLFGGTWSLRFNTDSVFFRTEGTLAAAGRSSGVQEDAIRNIAGRFVGSKDGAADGTVNGAFSVVSSAMGKTRGSDWNEYFNNNIFFNASTVVPTAAENRVKNRLIRVWERTA